MNINQCNCERTIDADNEQELIKEIKRQIKIERTWLNPTDEMGYIGVAVEITRLKNMLRGMNIIVR